MASLDNMEIKQKDNGIHSVQFAGTKLGKGGKEKPGANKKICHDGSSNGVPSHYMDVLNCSWDRSCKYR
jgi:hypothetical protein